MKMTPDERALRDAFLSEMWKPVPEWHQSATEQATAAERNQTLNRAIPTTPQNDRALSTGCAENGGPAPSEGHAECA